MLDLHSASPSCYTWSLAWENPSISLPQSFVIQPNHEGDKPVSSMMTVAAKLDVQVTHGHAFVLYNRIIPHHPNCTFAIHEKYYTNN